MKTNVVKIKDKEQDQLKRFILEQKEVIKQTKTVIEETKRQLDAQEYALMLQEGELYELLDSQTCDEDEQETADDRPRFKCPECGSPFFRESQTGVWVAANFEIIEGKPEFEENKQKDGNATEYYCTDCGYYLPVSGYDEFEEWVEKGCPV